MSDILILDDDEQITRMASLMLERKAGYTTATTESGEEALTILEEVPVRLLITDILMPGIDGIEIINQSRKRYPDLKIIAMSGGRRKITADFNLKSASMLGADATLAKPFNQTQLLKLVNELINR